jgi:cytidylate kinase
MNVVITIAGLHGTGKTTYAAALAEYLGLRMISAGRLFRQIADERRLTLEELSIVASKDSTIDKEIDGRMLSETQKGNVVLDGLLSAWIARSYAGMRIYLVAPEEIRIRRIARRERIPFETAKRETLTREEMERERFKRLYGFDIDSLDIYDLVMNTALLPKSSNLKVLKIAAWEYIATRARVGAIARH